MNYEIAYQTLREKVEELSAKIKLMRTENSELKKRNIKQHEQIEEISKGTVAQLEMDKLVLKSENSELAQKVPWRTLYTEGWRIVGMNHYNLDGQSHLFCSMSKKSVCIVAEGVDERGVFETLEREAGER